MNDSPRRFAPVNNASTDTSIDEVHLSDYVDVLLRRRKVFVSIFAAVLAGVTLFTFLSRPVYETTATLHVRNDKFRGGFLDDLGLTRENPVLTEIEILTARTNVEEVVRRLRLDWQIEGEARFEIANFEPPPQSSGYRVRLTAPGRYTVSAVDGQELGAGEVGTQFRAAGLTLRFESFAGKTGSELLFTPLPFNARVAQVRAGVNASEVGKGTNIIKVAYRHTDPVLARDVVNTLTQVYLERGVAIKAQEASRTVEFVGEQLDQVRDNLDAAEKDLESYKSANGVVKLDSEAESLITLVADAEKVRAAAQLRRHQAGFAADALRQVLARKEPYAPAILLDDPVVGELAKRLAALEIERRAQQVELTEDHPTLITLQAQILEVRQKLLANYIAIGRGLDEQVRALNASISGYEESLKALPAAERDLARLTRLARVSADIYTFLLQKHEEARIAQAATISSISVIDPALVPEQPAKPQKKKNLLLGLVVGLMVGIGAAFFVDYLDDTLNDGDEATRLLGWPVLAVIPFISSHVELRRSEDDAEEYHRALISHLQPKSAAAESFRALRTSLHFTHVGRGKQVLLVTSTLPNEGKTTVAANLAETIAQTGVRVLLVGCDLRKPTLHRVFKTTRSPGLTEVLIGDADLASTLHATEVPHLDFISAGISPPNPAELLGSLSMGEFVAQVRERYDVIVLDAPPLLAVTDASLLTTFADLSVIVLAAGHVPAKAARRTQELLLQGDVPVAGLVLNDKLARAFEYYAYYRYRYGYGYSGYESRDGATPTVSKAQRFWKHFLRW